MQLPTNFVFEYLFYRCFIFQGTFLVSSSDGALSGHKIIFQKEWLGMLSPFIVKSKFFICLREQLYTLEMRTKINSAYLYGSYCTCIQDNEPYIFNAIRTVDFIASLST